MAITADFWADYIDALKAHVQSSGMVLGGSESDNEVFIAFFNRRMRTIQQTPRKVLKATDLNVPPDLQNGFEMVCKEIETGADLQPRTSKKIRDWYYTDPLLAEWGIHHLHLGTSTDSSGFVTRTGPLLYARFEHTSAYLVAVLQHGAWTNEQLLEVLHRDWRDSISRFLIGNFSLNNELTEAERTSFRKHGINAPVRLNDGTVYGSPGGGLASDGTPAAVSWQLASSRRMLRTHQKASMRYFQSLPGNHGDDSRITLVLDGTHAYAYEAKSSSRLPLW